MIPFNSWRRWLPSVWPRLETSEHDAPSSCQARRAAMLSGFSPESSERASLLRPDRGLLFRVARHEIQSFCAVNRWRSCPIAEKNCSELCPRGSGLIAAIVFIDVTANERNGVSRSRSLTFRDVRHCQQKSIVRRHELKTGILILPAWLTLANCSTMLKCHEALMATED